MPNTLVTWHELPEVRQSDFQADFLGTRDLARALAALLEVRQSDFLPYAPGGRQISWRTFLGGEYLLIGAPRRQNVHSVRAVFSCLAPNIDHLDP